MKLTSTILAIVLPLAAYASAVPEADPDPAKLVARSRVCSIIGNDGPVACRSSPSINAPRVGNRLPVGSSYTFSCYKGGSCVFGNCNWDYIPSKGCYVSAHYTDASCTTSTLPHCS